ncbi:hypothetical protein TSUD_170120 [Trifolium subterraneum]|uniref:Malectin-like domain-containing protein n=1 Tax=Trifolium subterraneum TaxID=3900 RepID=A0A2Z6NDJ1_TRISU|nr:hypothetical protein TSUD_170120 [Trifolium subterraneum]
MPSFLYYTDLDDSNYHLNLLDTDNREYQIHNDKALEMVYRVNVGQNQVPPNQDTGMFRNWDNDFPLYLEKQYPQSEPVDFGDHLNFVNNTIPNYTAPEDVYLTARSYGEYVKEDYNVTWNFEVDSTFTYMAEQMADVIGWAGARMIPIHNQARCSFHVLLDTHPGSLSTPPRIVELLHQDNSWQQLLL